MNRILIEINTVNDAFRYDNSVELTRILIELTKDMQDHGVRDRLLHDINGNAVGEVITDRPSILRWIPQNFKGAIR